MAPHARITAALLAAMWLAAGSLAGAQPTGEERPTCGTSRC